MKCRSKQIMSAHLARCAGFSLTEAVTALLILGIVCSSILAVINRCLVSATDQGLRMQAFAVARENMEKLLAADSVKEMIEYGSSELYPGIEWETAVETFYEPATSRMWVQATCSAEYVDSDGEKQTIELTSWLTDLSKKEILEIMEEKQKERDALAEQEQIIGTLAEAAEYAGVDEQTIHEWIDNGMAQTEDGEFIKDELDFYMETDGKPTIEDRQRYEEAKRRRQESLPGQDLLEGEELGADGLEGPGTGKGDSRRIGGHTKEELNQMDVPQLLDLMLNSDQF